MSARAKQKAAFVDPVAAAAMDFEPCGLLLEDLPTNEQFGSRMVSIRFANLYLRLSKPELIDVVRKMSSDEADLEALGALMNELEKLRGVLDEMAHMCGNAHARLYVAVCAVEIEQDKRREKRTPKKKPKAKG